MTFIYEKFVFCFFRSTIKHIALILAGGEPAVEGGGGDFPEGAGAVDAALPVANANLDVAPGIEVGSVELEADAVESGVDAVKDGYQFGGGTIRGSGGIQQKVTH